MVQAKIQEHASCKKQKKKFSFREARLIKNCGQQILNQAQSQQKRLGIE